MLNQQEYIHQFHRNISLQYSDYGHFLLCPRVNQNKNTILPLPFDNGSEKTYKGRIFENGELILPFEEEPEVMRPVGNPLSFIISNMAISECYTDEASDWHNRINKILEIGYFGPYSDCVTLGETGKVFEYKQSANAFVATMRVGPFEPRHFAIQLYQTE